MTVHFSIRYKYRQMFAINKFNQSSKQTIVLVNYNVRESHVYTAFSLNFSSAGKGPFIARGALSWGYARGHWIAGHGLALAGKFKS